MPIVTPIAIGIVAALHIYFMILEMFLWDKPLGLKTFNQTIEKARATKTLAANQGLYNGFIASGLIWGIVRGGNGEEFILFFLLCVIVAGIYGAMTANRKILFVQALPGLMALLLVLFN